MQRSDQKGISNPCFIVTLLTKVKSSILTRLTYKIKLLKNLIHRGYLTSTVDSLRQVFFAKYMNYLSLELVSSTNN